MAEHRYRIDEDAEALHEFARYLDDLAEELLQEGTKAKEELDELEEHWRDEHYSAFREKLETELPQIGRFAEEATNFADFLRRRANAIEEYARS